ASGPSGQLLERRTRENDPIETFTYPDGKSELVSERRDPTGAVTKLAYVGGKLQTITDPGDRVTTLQIDAMGDLRTLTLPEATVYKFEYEHHRMTKKTSPEG